MDVVRAGGCAPRSNAVFANFKFVVGERIVKNGKGFEIRMLIQAIDRDMWSRTSRGLWIIGWKTVTRTYITRLPGRKTSGGKHVIRVPQGVPTQDLADSP